MGLFNKLLHAGEGRKVKFLQSLVPEVAAHEAATQALSDEQLAAKTVEFRQRIDRAKSGAKHLDHEKELVQDALDELLPEAFAVVREAARRVLGQRHYDVQVMGGAALHHGWVAEMKTGEGKTLVSTLPAYLNALPGRGVHLVTVNDYLARRDAEWMGRVHRFLGLNVGVVVPGRETPDYKRSQYDCDITYGTNNEFGFDYLRDNMCVRREAQVQWGNRERVPGLGAHFFAVVDEIDSILIDEARTPLIISGQASEAAELYYQFARIARSLQRDRDYEVDEAKRNVVVTEEGIDRVEDALGVRNLYDNVNQNYVHQLQQALKGKELFKRDVDYIVADGEVKIVDEFTGRILEGRRWSEGLHQAVEAKEGVRIKEENQTLATVTLQNYFRMYEKLAGMTGTAYTEAGEFMHTYELAVVPIPTNRAMVRADEGDLIYKGVEGKYQAVIDDIAERHEVGQPVLVGTISVEQSELLSRMLGKRGIAHEVLNAKNHEREANIITQAGQIGAVTVATNMAGRGVDILLGGNPEGLAKTALQQEGLDWEQEPERYEELVARFKAETDAEGEQVRQLGGLYVVGTERHESRRIDNQLRGRSGRQGDPGETRFYLSLEDDLMRLFATGVMQRVMNATFPDDMPLEARMVTKAIERAQRTVEDRNFEIRKNVLKYDEVMNSQRKVIYGRRQQILDGEELRDQALQAVEHLIDHVVDTYCGGEFEEQWDTEGLVKDMKSFFPSAITEEQVRAMRNLEQLRAAYREEAAALYEAREAELGTENMRDIERRVMLSVIDQHWREHLYEMDYLQEGINLRAMGQQDPLSAWQREGFDMFEAMMASIDEDFVRYVYHLQVVAEPEPALQAPQRLSYSAPEDPSEQSGAAGIRAAAAAEAAAGSGIVAAEEAPGAMGAVPSAVSTSAPRATPAPVRAEKTPGRNEPCYCGSGKKYKLCHGR